MAEKKSTRGRPRTAIEGSVAYQVRLAPVEAELFNQLVKKRALAATGDENSLSAASVIRGLVRRALVDEGLLAEPGGSRNAVADEPAPKTAKRSPAK